MNLYCANLNKLSGYYNVSQKNKNGIVIKNFLYIGRFSEEKGVRILLDAWEKVNKLIDWKLTFIGKGDLKNDILNHLSIEVIDYIQPSQFGELIDNYGCVILPSINEPWNVTVQEVCALGFPVIASMSIPSATVFIEDNKNGFTYNNNCIDLLASSIIKISSLKNEELLKMSNKSIEFSTRIVPTSTINSIESLFCRAK